MPIEPRDRPTLLCLSGLDPSGGAGLQADIETVTALGGDARVVATCLTVQDHRRLYRAEAVSAELLREQIDCLAEDGGFDGIKIGALCDAATAETIAEALRDLPNIPVVLDPVIEAGGGGRLADVRTVDSIRQALLPAVTLVTPNAAEAAMLAGTESDTLDAAAALSRAATTDILLTDRDPSGARIETELWRDGECLASWQADRLPGRFRGTGCMLSTAIALELANGRSVTDAVTSARSFVHNAISEARTAADDLQIPDRKNAVSNAS